jgi:hypothetical protein
MNKTHIESFNPIFEILQDIDNREQYVPPTPPPPKWYIDRPTTTTRATDSSARKYSYTQRHDSDIHTKGYI